MPGAEQAPQVPQEPSQEVVAQQTQTAGTEAGSYDHLFDPTTDLSGGNVEDAAVRPPVDTSVHREVEQRMSLHRADRANREAAGLPPRVHDLR